MKLEEVKKDKVAKNDEAITNISGIDASAENFSAYVQAVKYIKDSNPKLYDKIMNWD